MGWGYVDDEGDEDRTAGHCEGMPGTGVRAWACTHAPTAARRSATLGPILTGTFPGQHQDKVLRHLTTRGKPPPRLSLDTLPRSCGRRARTSLQVG